MRNFVSSLSAIFVSLVLSGTVYAAVPNLSIRLQQPKTPTNISDLKITVVTLDRLDRNVTVKCYKKGPSDGSFSQFGSDMVVIPGGNSVTCDTNSGIMNTNGTYEFQATAQADADLETSPIVSVSYNTSGPGTPVNYGKERMNVCDYKIKFRTADDSGKTVKVEVYRSENTSFDLNNGSRVDTIVIGSSTDGQSVTTPPQCDKDYYFAVRAFDTNGNGSGAVGDSVIKTTTTTTTTSTTTGAASGASGTSGGALASGSSGNVLGRQTEVDADTTGSEGEVKGDATPSATPTAEVAESEEKPPYAKTIAIVAGIILFGILAFLFRKKPTVQ